MYLNLHYISPQSVGMVLIQTMVNMLARTNQGIFHLVVLQFICHSGTVLYTLTAVQPVCMCECEKVGGRPRKSEGAQPCLVP